MLLGCGAAENTLLPKPTRTAAAKKAQKQTPRLRRIWGAIGLINLLRFRCSLRDCCINGRLPLRLECVPQTLPTRQFVIRLAKQAVQHTTIGIRSPLPSLGAAALTQTHGTYSTFPNYISLRAHRGSLPLSSRYLLAGHLSRLVICAPLCRIIPIKRHNSGKSEPAVGYCTNQI
jgi:hypothetical protein